MARFVGNAMGLWNFDGKTSESGLLLQIARMVCLDVSDELDVDIMELVTVSRVELIIISMHRVQGGWHYYVGIYVFWKAGIYVISLLCLERECPGWEG